MQHQQPAAPQSPGRRSAGSTLAALPPPPLPSRRLHLHDLQQPLRVVHPYLHPCLQTLNALVQHHEQHGCRTLAQQQQRWVLARAAGAVPRRCAAQALPHICCLCAIGWSGCAGGAEEGAVGSVCAAGMMGVAHAAPLLPACHSPHTTHSTLLIYIRAPAVLCCGQHDDQQQHLHPLLICASAGQPLLHIVSVGGGGGASGPAGRACGCAARRCINPSGQLQNPQGTLPHALIYCCCAQTWWRLDAGCVSGLLLELLLPWGRASEPIGLLSSPACAVHTPLSRHLAHCRSGVRRLCMY